MRLYEINKPTWQTKYAAVEELSEIYQRVYFDEPEPPLAELVEYAKKAQACIKICGRNATPHRRAVTAEVMYNDIMMTLQRAKFKAGKFELPTSGTVLLFAKQVALYFKSFGAVYIAKRGTVWSSSGGGKYRDPSDTVEFPTAESRDEAYEILAKKGKKIHVEMHSHLTEFIKIGNVLITTNDHIAMPFSSNPEATYALTFQTTAILRNQMRSVKDISDQTAHTLHDIANTRNEQAFKKIKAFLGYMQDEDSFREIIQRSQKITPQDKAKLDKIIAGADSFKED